MAMTPGAAASRVFYGWWVALALGISVFLSHQTGAALGSWLGGALFDLTGGYGAAFSVVGTLLLIAAVLSIVIDEQARPVGRAVALPVRPHPVAGGH